MLVATLGVVSSPVVFVAHFHLKIFETIVLVGFLVQILVSRHLHFVNVTYLLKVHTPPVAYSGFREGHF
jgi:hypothetical protein